MSKNWSEYQLAIFNHIENETCNLIVEAVAGSGKTTTSVEAVKRCKGSSVFLAFNKSIATELGQRGVNAKTFHGLCYSPTLNFKKCNKVEQYKTRKLIDANFSYEQSEIYGSLLTKLIGLGKNTGVGCLFSNDCSVWEQIFNHYDMQIDDERGNELELFELCCKLLDISNKSGMVDFDDMLYFPVLFNIPLPRFNNVFVDEAQDTNAIQREILKRVMMMMPSGRLIAVGDPAQAIYGFRGADSSALDSIAREFHAQRLPLSVSYRCARAVVERARNWVTHIEPAPDAPEGIVRTTTSWKLDDLNSSDLVVCRTTAPVLQLAYKCLKAHKPVKVLGRDIGEGLINLIKRQKLAIDIPTLLIALEAWCARETQKAGQDEAKAASASDKVDSIRMLAESLPESDYTIGGLCNVIETIFSDKHNAVTLCTIHKAKGLESDRVWWLNASECPSKWAKSFWQRQQERNLCYVAATRAKTELVLAELVDLI